MRCEECLPLIEVLFDGELSGRTADFVSGHLAACESCANAYEALRREQELYLRYECDVEVTRAFWANVESRITAENQARSSGPLLRLRKRLIGELSTLASLRFSPSLTAAIVLLAIGITAGLMRHINSRERADQLAVSHDQDVRVAPPSTELSTGVALDKAKSDTTRREDLQIQVANSNDEERKSEASFAARWKGIKRLPRGPEASPRQPTPDELVREAEQKYIAAIAMLSRDLNRRRSRLDPETLLRFEQTLAAVDRTIEGTRRAVRQHPDDPVAVQYMLTAYAKKVDLLRELVSY